MINMFSGLFLFYMKQLIRSPLYIGSMAFMTVMLISRFIIEMNETFDYMDYGSFVGTMMLIVQAMMLLFMIFFYKLFSDEFKFGANNLFTGSFRIIIIKIFSLLCSHLLFLFLFITLQLTLIYIYFYISGIPFSSFYIQTASFVFVYWYLPFVFASLLGILAALVFGKNKSSFVIMLICWLAIGPMNVELFSQYFRQLSPSDFGVIFHIGPLVGYKELVGYNISLSSYLKILFWIFLSIAMIFLALIKSARTLRDKSILLGIVVFLVIGNSSIFPKILEYSKPIFSYAASKQEDLYYKSYQSNVDKSNLQYSIRQYDIHLNNTEHARVKTKITVSNIKSNQLTFALYHNFKVKKVTNMKNQPLEFKQEGDFVSVKRLSKTSKSELTFYYKMSDSATFPVSNNYLFLPNYLSWLPTKADHPQYKYYGIFGGDVVPLSMQRKKPIKYNLTYDGELPIYTNLKKTDDGSYSEIVSGGISVLGGMITKKKFNDRVVIYPNAWSDIASDWGIYEQILIDVHKEIVNMFDINNLDFPREIILITPNLERDAYLSSDHLIIEHGTLLNISSAVDEIPKIYLKALLWNYDDRNFEQYEQIMAFNNLLATYIKGELEFESPEYAPTATMPPPFLSTQESIKKFYEKYHQLTSEQQRKFLITWYKEMHNVSDSWSKTVELLQDFKEDI